MKILACWKYLSEMADGIAQIRADLRNCSTTLRIHLTMVYLYPDNINVNHWKNEIVGACNSVSKAKNNNKYPKASVIYHELWGYYSDGFFDKVSKSVDSICDREALPYPSFNPLDLYTFLDHYYRWLSNTLQSEGEVSSPEVKHKIDELIKQFGGI